MKTKEYLKNAFGIFGVVLYYLFSMAIFSIPIWMLDINFWAMLLLFLVMLWLPIVGPVTRIIVYILAFTKAIHMPLDIFTIAYYISLALFVAAEGIPFFLRILRSLSQKQ